MDAVLAPIIDSGQAIHKKHEKLNELRCYFIELLNPA
jgi:hypothetical protein